MERGSIERLVTRIVEGVPILQDPGAALYGGAAYFWCEEVEAIIVHPSLSAGDTYGLWNVVHEAFHAARRRRGVPFYEKVAAEHTWSQLCEEEREVNREAWEWLSLTYQEEVIHREVSDYRDLADYHYDPASSPPALWITMVQSKRGATRQQRDEWKATIGAEILRQTCGKEGS